MGRLKGVLLLTPSEHSEGISKFEVATADVRSWDIHNRLILNDNKTEIIVHVNSELRETSSLPVVKIVGVEIVS